jgi:hypothetical protein
MGKFSRMRDTLLQSGSVTLFMISPYYSIGLSLSISIALCLGSIVCHSLYRFLFQVSPALYSLVTSVFVLSILIKG